MLARESSEATDRTVAAVLNYFGPMTEKPRYFASDRSRDRVTTDRQAVVISDARSWSETPDLDREGFRLVHHRSRVRDFRNQSEVAAIHRVEIETLLRDLCGADQVIVAPGGLRFSERSPAAGKRHNSLPGRLAHIDFSDVTAAKRAATLAPGGLAKVRRYAFYNIWRVLSPPPQDTTLAVCDARSVAVGDLVPIDFVYDAPNVPEWTFEGLVARCNPAHRWAYWSNMGRDEALIFKGHDSDPACAHAVPHSAFDDPTCPPDALPRVSIEMRAFALWSA